MCFQIITDQSFLSLPVAFPASFVGLVCAPDELRRNRELRDIRKSLENVRILLKILERGQINSEGENSLNQKRAKDQDPDTILS